MLGLLGKLFGPKKKPIVQRIARLNGMKFQKGDLVEVVANTAGHNQVGMRFTMMGYNGMYVRMEDSQFSFAEADLKLLPLPKEVLKTRFDSATALAQLLKEQMEYMEEEEVEELDTEVFRKYQIKKLLSNDNLPADVKASRIHAIYSEML